MKDLFGEGGTDYMPLIIEYGQKLAVGILILVIGLWLAGMITKAAKKLMAARKLDAALQSFLGSMLGIALKILVVITALGTLGIEMTSFVAILGAASLAVGMALSGTLQNFAGGVIILILKPFKIGDVLEAQGYVGSVSDIQIFNTILKTPDNKTIIIPNGGLSTGSMINYSTEARRRVDWTIGIGYGDDADKAEQVLLQMLKDDKRVLQDPAPFIALSALADSSVNFTVRAWVDAADYWSVFFDLNKRVYKEFGQHGLNIPFPQMDIHLHNK
ncbi:MAG: mechanosensitive ion channel [Flavobacteriales bacterium]|nr:mechanosensitive ion channel [Flavobacteriales bacterium]